MKILISGEIHLEFCDLRFESNTNEKKGKFMLHDEVMCEKIYHRKLSEIDNHPIA